MNPEKQIELRSEKVRNIIGRIPSVLVRYGTLIIGIALLIFVAIALFIPYRETVPVTITLKMVPEAEYVAAKKSSIEIIKEMKDSVPEDSDTMFEGKIILNVKNGTYIPQGDTLLAVLPFENSIYGITKIHQSHLSKMKEGNRVLINYAVVGYFEGTVEAIDKIPPENNPSFRNVRIVFDSNSDIRQFLQTTAMGLTLEHNLPVSLECGSLSFFLPLSPVFNRRPFF